MKYGLARLLTNDQLETTIDNHNFIHPIDRTPEENMEIFHAEMRHRSRERSGPKQACPEKERCRGAESRAEYTSRPDTDAEEAQALFQILRAVARDQVASDHTQYAVEMFTHMSADVEREVRRLIADAPIENPYAVPHVDEYRPEEVMYIRKRYWRAFYALQEAARRYEYRERERVDSDARYAAHRAEKARRRKERAKKAKAAVRQAVQWNEERKQHAEVRRLAAEEAERQRREKDLSPGANLLLGLVGVTLIFVGPAYLFFGAVVAEPLAWVSYGAVTLNALIDAATAPPPRDESSAKDLRK